MDKLAELALHQSPLNQKPTELKCTRKQTFTKGALSSYESVSVGMLGHKISSLLGVSNYPARLHAVHENLGPNLAQNLHFWSFLVNYWPFWPKWCLARSQKQCASGFLIRRYQNYYSLRKWLECLAKKRSYLPQICLLGHIQALPSHLVPGWLVGWWLWRARCSIDRAST